MVVLANPNNPDGRRSSESDCLPSRRCLPERAGRLMVDEAFADVMPEHSVCRVREDQRAKGSSSFGRSASFMGSPECGSGLWSLPAPGRDEPSRSALGDWPVSGPAVAIGTAAYRDVGWQSMQRERLTIASAAAARRLLTRAGFTIAGGTALFRLARCAEAECGSNISPLTAFSLVLFPAIARSCVSACPPMKRIGSGSPSLRLRGAPNERNT